MVIVLRRAIVRTRGSDRTARQHGFAEVGIVHLWRRLNPSSIASLNHGTARHEIPGLLLREMDRFLAQPLERITCVGDGNCIRQRGCVFVVCYVASSTSGGCEIISRKCGTYGFVLAQK